MAMRRLSKFLAVSCAVLVTSFSMAFSTSPANASIDDSPPNPPACAATVKNDRTRNDKKAHHSNKTLDELLRRDKRVANYCGTLHNALAVLKQSTSAPVAAAATATPVTVRTPVPAPKMAAAPTAAPSLKPCTSQSCLSNARSVLVQCSSTMPNANTVALYACLKAQLARQGIAAPSTSAP